MPINHLLNDNTLKYYVFENIMENEANAPIENMENALFSMILSKVVKTLLKLFLIFFQCCLKIENDVMIFKKAY